MRCSAVGRSRRLVGITAVLARAQVGRVPVVPVMLDVRLFEAAVVLAGLEEQCGERWDVGRSRWRRNLSYAWWHAEVGAELAAAAGLS